MTAAAPRNQREALAWARRNLVRQLQPLVAALPETHRRRDFPICRHERDARNIARGYLSDDFIDAFPEVELDGNWPRIAAQLTSMASEFFAYFPEGHRGILEFYTCTKCGTNR